MRVLYIYTYTHLSRFAGKHIYQQNRYSTRMFTFGAWHSGQAKVCNCCVICNVVWRFRLCRAQKMFVELFTWRPNRTMGLRTPVKGEKQLENATTPANASGRSGPESEQDDLLLPRKSNWVRDSKVLGDEWKCGLSDGVTPRNILPNKHKHIKCIALWNIRDAVEMCDRLYNENNDDCILRICYRSDFERHATTNSYKSAINGTCC